MIHFVRTRTIIDPNKLFNGGFQRRIRVPITTTCSSSNASTTNLGSNYQYYGGCERKWFSSSVSSQDDVVCLYRRCENRVWFPRGLLAFTTLHTGYWTWYILDFVPAVAEAATVPVDSTVGYVGWTMSALMWGLTAIYPTYLIQQLSYQKQTHEFIVQTYQLPLLSSQRTTTTTYPSVTLDNPQDVHRILSTLSGDITSMRGHLAIQTSNNTTTPSPNLLLHLTDNAKEEILHNDLLLQSLLSFPTNKQSTPQDGGKQTRTNKKIQTIQRMKRRQTRIQRKK